MSFRSTTSMKEITVSIDIVTPGCQSTNPCFFPSNQQIHRIGEYRCSRNRWRFRSVLGRLPASERTRLFPCFGRSLIAPFSLLFHAPLNAWEFDGMPSMEGEADLSFASSVSRLFLICENLRHLWMVCLSVDDADFRRRRELENRLLHPRS